MSAGSAVPPTAQASPVAERLPPMRPKAIEMARAAVAFSGRRFAVDGRRGGADLSAVPGNSGRSARAWVAGLSVYGRNSADLEHDRDRATQRDGQQEPYHRP